VRERLNEARLSVFVAKTVSRRALFRVALWALIGRAKQLDEFDVRSMDIVTVKTTRRRLHVSRDGEIILLTTPLKYKMHKKALRVLY